MGAVTGTEVEEVDVVAVVGSNEEVVVDSDGILSPGLVPYSYTLNLSDPIPPDSLLKGT